jgi:hypothetical protein
MNTTEGNKLIAEFMNVDLMTLKGEGVIEFIKVQEYFLRSAKYHSSWDWLMPVVEKIEKLGFTFEKNYQRIDGDWQALIVKGNDILFQDFNVNSLLATHYVVCEFIQWYDKNK